MFVCSIKKEQETNCTLKANQTCDRVFAVPFSLHPIFLMIPEALAGVKVVFIWWLDNPIA